MNHATPGQVQQLRPTMAPLLGREQLALNVITDECPKNSVAVSAEGTGNTFCTSCLNAASNLAPASLWRGLQQAGEKILGAWINRAVTGPDFEPQNHEPHWPSRGSCPIRRSCLPLRKAAFTENLQRVRAA